MNFFQAIPGTAAMLAAVLLIPQAAADDALPADDGPFHAAPLSDDMLAGQRGKALITNTNDLDAALYENSALDVVTGNNGVSDGSLANNAGLATLIQNSGNNVLIQNALILNIQMQ